MCCGGKINGHHKNSGKDCCFGHEVVQDRVCCKFTLNNTSAAEQVLDQDIYFNNTGQCIVASGTISLGCALAPGVVATVRFFRGGASVGNDPVGGGTLVGTPIIIGEESCVTFTATGFTRINIQVTLPAGGRVSGNICITPRYQLHV